MSPSPEEMVAGLVLFLLGFFVLTLVFNKINQAINNLQEQVDNLGVELARVEKGKKEEEVVDLVLVEDGILLAPEQAHPSHTLEVVEGEVNGDERVMFYSYVQCVLCKLQEHQHGFNLQCRSRMKG